MSQAYSAKASASQVGSVPAEWDIDWPFPATAAGTWPPGWPHVADPDVDLDVTVTDKQYISTAVSVNAKCLTVAVDTDAHDGEVIRITADIGGTEVQLRRLESDSYASEVFVEITNYTGTEYGILEDIFLDLDETNDTDVVTLSFAIASVTPEIVATTTTTMHLLVVDVTAPATASIGQAIAMVVKILDELAADSDLLEGDWLSLTCANAGAAVSLAKELTDEFAVTLYYNIHNYTGGEYGFSEDVYANVAIGDTGDTLTFTATLTSRTPAINGNDTSVADVMNIDVSVTPDPLELGNAATVTMKTLDGAGADTDNFNGGTIRVTAAVDGRAVQIKKLVGDDWASSLDYGITNYAPPSYGFTNTLYVRTLPTDHDAALTLTGSVLLTLPAVTGTGAVTVEGLEVSVAGPTDGDIGLEYTVTANVLDGAADNSTLLDGETLTVRARIGSTTVQCKKLIGDPFTDSITYVVANYSGALYGFSDGIFFDVADVDLIGDTLVIEVAAEAREPDVEGQDDLILFDDAAYLYGGYWTGYTAYQTCWRYAASTWIQMASMPSPGRERPGASTISGKGYVYHGWSYPSFLADCEEYTVSTNIWVSKASNDQAPTGRREIAACTVGTKGYVFVGYTGSYITNCDDFDPSANTWAANTAVTGVARRSSAAFAISTDAYVAGGESASGASLLTKKYTPGTDTWADAQGLPTYARYSAGVMEIGSDGYVVGGESTFGGARNLNSKFDGTSWAAKTPMLRARSGCTGVGFTNTGLVSGGSDGFYPGPSRTHESYSAASGTWRTETVSAQTFIATGGSAI